MVQKNSLQCLGREAGNSTSLTMANHCLWGGGSGSCRSWLIIRRNFKEHVVGVVKRDGKIQKNSDTVFVPLGCCEAGQMPHHWPSIRSHYIIRWCSYSGSTPDIRLNSFTTIPTLETEERGMQCLPPREQCQVCSPRHPSQTRCKLFSVEPRTLKKKKKKLHVAEPAVCALDSFCQQAGWGEHCDENRLLSIGTPQQKTVFFDGSHAPHPFYYSPPPGGWDE